MHDVWQTASDKTCTDMLGQWFRLAEAGIRGTYKYRLVRSNQRQSESILCCRREGGGLDAYCEPGPGTAGIRSDPLKRSFPLLKKTGGYLKDGR
jgi:hypothetical protein